MENQPTSLDLYAMNFFLVQEAANDPEDSLQMAVTRRELALLLFGALLIGRLFPELSMYCAELYQKLTELSEAQDFLDVESGMRRTMGLE